MQKAGSALKLKGAARRELMDHLYPVELVRAYAEEIELTPKQIEKLRKVVSDVQTELEQLKWDVTRETQKLMRLIAKGGSKDQVYAQLDQVFKYENKIKKKQLGLMIVIRDILTKKQREQLDKVKAEHFAARGRPGHGGGPPPHAGPPHGPGGPSAPF
jgi:Spy/CpxP family protein refolding chaperone